MNTFIETHKTRWEKKTIFNVTLGETFNANINACLNYFLVPNKRPWTPKNPPWTTLLGTGRLLVFHFLSSIKDLEPQLFQTDDSENIPIVYFALDMYQFQ